MAKDNKKNEQSEKPPKKKKSLAEICVAAVIIVLIAVVLFLGVRALVNLKKIKREYSDKVDESVSLALENERQLDMLESENNSDNMENAARNRGYGYPNEVRATE